MKKQLLFILLAIVPMVASADIFEIDGLFYFFDYDLYGNYYVWVTSGNSKYTGDIIIPESVTYEGVNYNVTGIDISAFRECTDLKSVIIPNSVISINMLAFYGCSGLTSITIPSSVRGIGQSAFYQCIGLSKVIVPDIAAWCGISFSSYPGSNPLDYAHHIFSDEETEITDIVIPDGVTSIGAYAFSSCSGLSSVTIPNSMTNIGEWAFSGCSGLNSVTIPESVTSIGDGAFSGCSGLTSVTIPNSVTRIGKDAFSGCKLRNLLIKCTTPPTGGTAFSEQTYYHTTLYVPIGSWDAYAYDDSWYKFINIRETATSEEQLSMQQTYTLMDACTFTYSVYDPVNDCISTINSVGIDENNPNHSWQVIESAGSHYLYNVGAKKFVVSSGNGSFSLSDTPTSIDMENGDNGIIIGAQPAKQWALVTNERMSAEQAIIDGIDDISTVSQPNGSYYDIQGRKLSAPLKGINIIRYSDGTSRKVLVK